MARPDVLNRLKELGWDGPTSYTLPYLNEMIAALEGGTTVEELKATRKKTSSSEVKGQGRAPKGEWVTCDDPDPTSVAGPENTGEFEKDGVKYRWIVYTSTDDGSTSTVYERFVPTPKPARQRPEKGTWEVLVDHPQLEVMDPAGETEVEGTRYRWNTIVQENEDGSPGETYVRWEKFVPTPPKERKTAKLTGKQQADFDPREMLRVFENQDMRVRTGGRDWTMLPTDWLEEQLKAAQGRGDAAVLVDVDGSQEALDCIVLEALVSVKKRLALREEVNGDGQAAQPSE